MGKKMGQEHLVYVMEIALLETLSQIKYMGLEAIFIWKVIPFLQGYGKIIIFAFFCEFFFQLLFIYFFFFYVINIFIYLFGLFFLLVKEYI